MDYLDYLPDYSYDELPATIRGAIDRASYEERRQLILGLPKMDRSDVLSPALQTAFQAQRGDSVLREISGNNQQLKQGTNKRRPAVWLAAAGWLLFFVTGTLLFLRPPSEKTIYRLISAEVPAPAVVYLRDTVIQTVHRTRVRAQIDTLYLPAPLPEERLVYVQDTIFVPMPLGAPGQGVLNESRSLEGRESVLELLFATE